MNKNLVERIDELSKLGKAKIGFGLAKQDDQIIESLQKAKEFAEIIIVGTEVDGFECKTPENPEQELARMLAENEVDGIVRGTIDDFKTFEAYLSLTKQEKKDFFIPSCFEDAFGRQFFLFPASNPEGWTKEEKIQDGEKIAEFMKKFGIEAKIGIITGERHETYDRRKTNSEGVIGTLNKTYEDAEEIVSYFKTKNIPAKNYAIELNGAVNDGCNLVIVPNGMVGNQIFRALCFLGKGRVLIAPRASSSNVVYEDNSRNEKDFSLHIKYAVAWVNSKK